MVAGFPQHCDSPVISATPEGGRMPLKLVTVRYYLIFLQTLSNVPFLIVLQKLSNMLMRYARANVCTVPWLLVATAAMYSCLPACHSEPYFAVWNCKQ